MSKRKGRKPPINSEIKSVLRAPEELSETAGSEDAIEPGTEQEPEDLGSEDRAGPERESEPVAAGANEPDDEARAPELDADTMLGDAADAAFAAGHFDVMGGFAEAIEDQELPRLVPDNLEIEPDDTESFLSGLLEALLFTSQRPLALKELARAAGIDRPRAQELLERLIQSRSTTGVCIEEVAGGFIMRSSPRYAPHIQKLLALRPIRLSRAQLETLAIVAYRQPVTKPEVDDIRGVDTGQVLKGLMERNLLKILGKKDEPGRPMLYGTTTEFLELLSLTSLKDLPTLREYTELSDESRRKFSEATGEPAPSDPVAVSSDLGGADLDGSAPDLAEVSDAVLEGAVLEGAVLEGAERAAPEPPATDEVRPDNEGGAEDSGAETLDLEDILEASMSSEGPELPLDETASEPEGEGLADEETSPPLAHSTAEEQYSDGSETSTSNA